MKKLYSLILISLFFYRVQATNEVPNSSFTAWVSGNPTGWNANNAAGFFTPITDAGLGYTDAHAAKGQPVVYSGDTIGPVLTTTGSGYGFPITQNYTHLTFYLKSSLVNGDLLYVTVVIYDGSHSGLATGAATITSNAGSFTLQTVDINYFASGTAATAIISFALSSALESTAQPNPSSYFIIDDLALNTLVGVQEPASENNVQVYPNPAHDRISIKGQLSNDKHMQLMLCDGAGRMVMQKKSEAPANGFMDADLSLQGVAPGVYSLVMLADDRVMTKRIVVH